MPGPPCTTTKARSRTNEGSVQAASGGVPGICSSGGGLVPPQLMSNGKTTMDRDSRRARVHCMALSPMSQTRLSPNVLKVCDVAEPRRLDHARECASTQSRAHAAGEAAAEPCARAHSFEACACCD